MHLLVDALLFTWDKNLDYARRLLADIPEDKMAAQPAPNLNHAAWTFSHLNIYHPAIVAVLTKKPFEDTANHKFGMKSKPSTDRSLYPSKAELLATFTRGHESVAATLKALNESVLEEPPPLERWRTTMPKIGIWLNYLMTLHESTHLGQVSVWRRVQGMPAV